MPFLGGLVAGLVLASIVWGTIVAIVASEDDEATARDPQSTLATDAIASALEEGPTETSPTTEVTPTEPPEPVAVAPRPKDFDFEITITEKSCYGSAGGLATARVEPVWAGRSEPAGRWEVVYEVIGDENGPIRLSFELNNGRLNWQPEVSLSTSSCEPRVTAKVVDVLEGY